MPKPRAWREMDWLAPVDPDAEGTVRSALALIDLTMPEMDGEQTLSALRVHAPDLPAVFMSGHSNEAIGRRVAGKRRTSHIKKPFRMPALSQAVAELLFESGASA
jgi:CheY-like chemotaxis protein